MANNQRPLPSQLAKLSPEACGAGQRSDWDLRSGTWSGDHATHRECRPAGPPYRPAALGRWRCELALALAYLRRSRTAITTNPNAARTKVEGSGTGVRR